MMSFTAAFQKVGGRHRKRADGCRASFAGFSLVEVMVALVIFFMAVFAILGLMSTVLSNARALQNRKPADAGMVAAYLLSVTNQLTEGLQSGTFEDFGDFGGEYSNYEWTFDAREIETNGLWQVDCIVLRRPGGQLESQLSFFVFSPQSRGSLSGMLAGGLRP
jgi:type II secretory pathway component PulJ